MTIDKIKSNKILITLCDEDMRDFSLDYDEMPFPASNYFWKYTKQIIVIFLLKRIICLSKILNNVTMLL